MKNKGFTLVELLVVISLIAVLSSIVIARLSGARTSGDYLKHVSDLQQINLAITKYQLAYGSYPVTGVGWSAYNSCYVWTSNATTSKNYIPQLVPKYIVELPIEKQQGAGCSGYMYRSDNGSDYKLIYHNPTDISTAQKKNPEMIDPVRPTWAYGMWTPGAAAY